MKPVFDPAVWGDFPVVYTQVMRDRAGQPLPPGRTALLVVDMNNGCLHPEGFIAAVGGPVEAMRECIPFARRLIDAAHGAGVDVIYTTGGRTPVAPEVVTQVIDALTARAAAFAGQGKLRDPDAFLAGMRRIIEGESEPFGAQIVEELAPGRDDVVVAKHSEDAFFAGPSTEILTRDAYDAFIICGVSTDMCVMSTARSAVERGFKCVLVSDATATFEPLLQEAALRMFQAIYGDVLTTDETVEAIAALAPVRA